MSLKNSASSSVSLANFPILEKFLSHCPSQWQASQYITEKLENAHFKPLDMSQACEEGQGYWMDLGPGARLAFRARSQARHLSVIGCHTESPMLRIKEQGFLQEEGVWIAHVEPYGSPILASWMYKDLALCGRLLTETETGLSERFIHLNEPLGILLSPAIHLDREMNQKGLVPDKQKHLKVLLGNIQSEIHPLIKRLQSLVKEEKILSHELYFYPLEKAQPLSLDPNWVTSWRIDNLASCAACLEALLLTKTQTTSPLTLTIFADHEEIGSQTYSGAASNRYRETIDQILSWLGYIPLKQSRLKKEAFLYSVDGAHGLHPVYKELYEPHHAPRLGEGVVIKHNPLGRYITDARSAARLKWLASKADVQLQAFHMRADLPCGSTIGPILSTNLGMEGVDLGLAQLSMHASRELMHLKDYQDLVTLLSYAHLYPAASIETLTS